MLDLTAAFATFPILETERFILRAPTSDDAADTFRIMSDPRTMRYFGQLPLASLNQAIARVQDFQTAFEEQTGIRWVITNRTDGEFMGTCGFWRLLRLHLRAEIGYELAPDWWGQGVMTEALKPVLTFGFTHMGLHSVEAQIHPANVGSRRVLEKLGFVQEGHFRENYYDPVENQLTDTVVFSLLKSTWLKEAE
jgi:[ribosomal protein S5]-alanine N-acetyltransferase